MDQCRTFAPLAYSDDGMAGIEKCAFEKRIASFLAGKWNMKYSGLVGFICAKMAMAVVRVNTLLFTGFQEYFLTT